ncbi:MAG TPA: 2-C-methyl-D-erythritol 4-phosphate cytidylyltransferase [Steroidobacteraceae bacterium]|nr:2-C-methyl-D-erythritol 4-phosphate cytidylyltransferase [Steroidobacteraceae bacterium]
MHYWLIMPAAGSGQRAGGRQPKQYTEILGRTVIEWALDPFAGDARCAGMVVALAAGDRAWAHVARRGLSRVETTEGGATRSESVRRALAALAGRLSERDWVLVHDAARPCLPRADLDRLLEECRDHPLGGLLAAPVADTLKRCASDASVEQTIDRTGLWRALTPQMFRYGPLCAALDAAAAAGRSPTDESQALEWTGARPARILGSARNIKITTPEDLALAGALLGRQQAVESTMRIGSGIDVHAFGPGDFVMLGGVRIPHTGGVVAHSDGDVVLHALCDALLGAAALGDIGQHFRDDDPQWRGADSSRFVRAVLTLLKERGLTVVNADVTVLAEAPRLTRYRDEMRRTIAGLLELPDDRVNIKATTTERLGFLGRREGIGAQAVVLLREGRTDG